MEKALQKFEEELARYREGNKYNILVPTQTIQEISPYHKPVLEIVKINPDPLAGEVYQIVSGGDFCLRATALQKISYAAGIIWNARGCGRTDDGSKPSIVTYRAEGAVRKEDGTYMLLNAEYMLDLEVVEEETRESYEKKALDLIKAKTLTEGKKQEYIEKYVKRDMLQKRKFRLQLAQTGAMDRVIRKILGLKGTYKRAELEKAFIVPKIAFSPDISDPKIREALLKQGMEATNILFGPQETGLIEHASMKEDKHLIDVTPELEETLSSNGHETIKTDEKPDDSLDLLRNLMMKKGYDISKLKKPLEHFNESEAQALMKHLQSLPDQQDLPFEM